jgi:molybdopterin-guanine dinucleotide biosynthesis adapter protein
LAEGPDVMQKVIGICGFKNAGKTTLVEKLVQHLTGLGYRISTVKHAHHDFDIDQEGRDSFRHRRAGAGEVAVVSQKRLAVLSEFGDQPPPPLAEVLLRLQPCDLVIVEGYKRDFHDKIEVRNCTLHHPELAKGDATVVAVAANGPVAETHVPVFDRDDVSALAQFIINRYRLGVGQLAFRRAGKADAELVRQLTRKAYAKWVPVIGREPMPMKADFEMAVLDHWIDLASIDGDIVALIEMIPKSDHLYIENIAIAERFQGQGLTRQLMNQAESLARACGLAEMRLLTNKAFTSNLAVYDRLGFQIFAEVPFPGGGTTVHFRKPVS